MIYYFFIINYVNIQTDTRCSNFEVSTRTHCEQITAVLDKCQKRSVIPMYLELKDLKPGLIIWFVKDCDSSRSKWTENEIAISHLSPLNNSTDTFLKQLFASKLFYLLIFLQDSLSQSSKFQFHLREQFERFNANSPQIRGQQRSSSSSQGVLAWF